MLVAWPSLGVSRERSQNAQASKKFLFKKIKIRLTHKLQATSFRQQASSRVGPPNNVQGSEQLKLDSFRELGYNGIMLTQRVYEILQ